MFIDDRVTNIHPLHSSGAILALERSVELGTSQSIEGRFRPRMRPGEPLHKIPFSYGASRRRISRHPHELLMSVLSIERRCRYSHRLIYHSTLSPGSASSLGKGYHWVAQLRGEAFRDLPLNPGLS